MELHQREELFVMPNPWDAGSAVLLQQMGFSALGSSSAGFAFSQGLPDGKPTLEQVLAHLRAICAVTSLPVSADSEDFFAATPDEVFKNLAKVAATGVVGGSIQDSSGDPVPTLLPLSQAVERVQAAVEAKNSLPFPFVLTARAECLTNQSATLDETIVRLKAYEKAGADVLFAPWVKTEAEVKAILDEVSRPVSVMLGFAGSDLDVSILARLGVRRVSTGGSFARAAYSLMLRAAKEIQKEGTFAYAKEALTGNQLNQLFTS